MLKLARCPHSLIASLATLPSMSLIPFAPFASRRSTSNAQRRITPRLLSGHQFDLNLAVERSRSAIQSGQRDRCVCRIEQAMNRSARRPHTRSHRTLAHPLLLHQVVHLQRDSALERGRVDFLVQAFLFQEVFKVASAVLVLTSCCFWCRHSCVAEPALWLPLEISWFS